MLKWAPYVFVRIALFFILGILVGIYFNELISIKIAFCIIGITSFCFLMSKILLKKKYLFSLNWVQGIFALCTIFALGYLTVLVNNESLQSNHIIHFKNITHYRGVVDGSPEEKENTFKYDFDVRAINTNNNWHSTIGKVYLYIPKENKLLEYGDELLIQGQPNQISKPMNPAVFDYKRFLSFKNVYHQDYIHYNYKVIGYSEPNPIFLLSTRLRNHFSNVIDEYVPMQRENAIAKALILGVKDGIDNEIKAAYAASGAMHILAVSGLHVGVLYGILLLLFRPFRKTTFRNWLLVLVSLVVLWSYAMVTGFSPSVLRAVTMFSFIAIAQAMKRPTNIYNTLAAAAFGILVVSPFLIMSLGFQLSFLAVLGIVYIQPKLYNLVSVNNKLIDYFWAITTVSIAAQIATLPLSLLYFHQFPTYFLIANLFVIPAAFVILPVGLLLLTVSFISIIAQYVGLALQYVIYSVNYVVFHIMDFPYSQFKNIEINSLQAWLMILTVLSIIFLLEYRKFRFLIGAAISILLFMSLEFFQIDKSKSQLKITMYHVNDHLAIDFIDGSQAILYTDSVLKFDTENIAFNITPNRMQSGIITRKISNRKLPFVKTVKRMRIINWNGKNLLILDRKIPDKMKLDTRLRYDYIILADGFDYDGQWLIDNFDFEKIILDGSLNWYDANNLKTQMDSLNIAYHSIYHDGFFEINLKK